jgi:transposase
MGRMNGTQPELSEEGWELLPCPSCEGHGKKLILPRRELVAMRAGERDVQPVQVSLDCLLCVGTGFIQQRTVANRPGDFT